MQKKSIKLSCANSSENRMGRTQAKHREKVNTGKKYHGCTKRATAFCAPFTSSRNVQCIWCENLTLEGNISLHCSRRILLPNNLPKLSTVNRCQLQLPNHTNAPMALPPIARSRSQYCRFILYPTTITFRDNITSVRYHAIRLRMCWRLCPPAFLALCQAHYLCRVPRMLSAAHFDKSDAESCKISSK